jgi:[ribosomal protein S18]-alanine N-acetyltransferase
MSSEPLADLTIRNALPGDLAQISALAQSEFGDMWRAEVLAEKVVDDFSTFIAALSGSTLAGFVLGFTVLDEMDLQLLAVKPEMRRQGIAGRLTAALIAQGRTRGVRRIHLEVRESNRAARVLYAAMGFEESGLRRAYYHDPAENGLLLTCRIDTPPSP